jgi:tetratricopeptide (TPR) repeat protein
LQEEIARAVVAKIGGAFGIVAERLFQAARQKASPNLTAYETLLVYYHYKTAISPTTFHTTRTLVEQMLAKAPDSGVLWSALSNLDTDNYLLEFSPPITSALLETAEHYARKGVAFEPDNQATHMALAAIYFFQGALDRYAQEARDAYRLNPHNAYYMGIYGWCEMLRGHWEAGMRLLHEAVTLNPSYPSYFHVAFFLSQYAHQQYQKAYEEAVNINLPEVFFCPLFQTAALGQLGRQEDAEVPLETLMRLRPDFPARAHEFIGRLIKAEGEVEHLLEGLQKAGLQLERQDKQKNVIPFHTSRHPR